MVPLLLQIGSPLPSGFAEVVVWLAVAAVIVGLYLVIRRTRARTQRHYLDREQREQQMRRNDPDMRDE